MGCFVCPNRSDFDQLPPQRRTLHYYIQFCVCVFYMAKQKRNTVRQAVPNIPHNIDGSTQKLPEPVLNDPTGLLSL